MLTMLLYWTAIVLPSAHFEPRVGRRTGSARWLEIAQFLVLYFGLWTGHVDAPQLASVGRVNPSAKGHLRPEVRAWLQSELHEEALLATARNGTGLSVGLDAAFLEALRVLCHGLLGEARLNDTGLLAARTY